MTKFLAKLVVQLGVKANTRNLVSMSSEFPKFVECYVLTSTSNVFKIVDL